MHIQTQVTNHVQNYSLIVDGRHRTVSNIYTSVFKTTPTISIINLSLGLYLPDRMTTEYFFK
jgi:hypothetical protein